MAKHNVLNDELMLYWNSFLSGNKEAFATLYEKLVRDLFSFGTTFTSDTELIKDCIQDMFVRFFQDKTQLSAVKNVKIYLLVVLKNAIFNELKKREVFQKFIESYEAEESFTEESEEERIIAWEEEITKQHLLDKCRSVLTERQFEIIHYRFVDELSIEDISDMLNLSYQTVANSIQRSLTKIRNIYLHK